MSEKRKSVTEKDEKRKDSFKGKKGSVKEKIDEIEKNKNVTVLDKDKKGSGASGKERKGSVTGKERKSSITGKERKGSVTGTERKSSTTDGGKDKLGERRRSSLSKVEGKKKAEKGEETPKGERRGSKIQLVVKKSKQSNTAEEEGTKSGEAVSAEEDDQSAVLAEQGLGEDKDKAKDKDKKKKDKAGKESTEDGDLGEMEKDFGMMETMSAGSAESETSGKEKRKSKKGKKKRGAEDSLPASAAASDTRTEGETGDTSMFDDTSEGQQVASLPTYIPTTEEATTEDNFTRDESMVMPLSQGPSQPGSPEGNLKKKEKDQDQDEDRYSNRSGKSDKGSEKNAESEEKEKGEKGEEETLGTIVYQHVARYICMGPLRVAGGVRVLFDASAGQAYVQIISPLCEAYVTYYANNLTFLTSTSAAGVAWAAAVVGKDKECDEEKQGSTDDQNKKSESKTQAKKTDSKTKKEKEESKAAEPSKSFIDTAHVVFCDPYQAHRFKTVIETLKGATDSDNSLVTPCVPFDKMTSGFPCPSLLIDPCQRLCPPPLPPPCSATPIGPPNSGPPTGFSGTGQNTSSNYLGTFMCQSPPLVTNRHIVAPAYRNICNQVCNNSAMNYGDKPKSQTVYNQASTRNSQAPSMINQGAPMCCQPQPIMMPSQPAYVQAQPTFGHSQPKNYIQTQPTYNQSEDQGSYRPFCYRPPTTCTTTFATLTPEPPYMTPTNMPTRSPGPMMEPNRSRMDYNSYQPQQPPSDFNIGSQTPVKNRISFNDNVNVYPQSQESLVVSNNSGPATVETYDPYAYENCLPKTLFSAPACLVRLNGNSAWVEMQKGCLKIYQCPNQGDYCIVLENKDRAISTHQYLTAETVFLPSDKTQFGYTYSTVTRTENRGVTVDHFMVCFINNNAALQFKSIVDSIKQTLETELNNMML